MDIYRERILDHYKHPRNFGHLSRIDFSNESYNSTCGDKIRMELTCRSKNAKHNAIIDDVRFSGIGCAISQASASLLTEFIKGKSIEKIMKLTREDIMALLQTALTPSRVKCALLPLEALHKAVSSTGRHK